MSKFKKPPFQITYGVKVSPEMAVEIHKVIEEYCDRELEKIVKKVVAKRLTQIVKECLEERDKATEESVVELKRIPNKEAVVQIQDYVDKHQGCRTSDIIYNLELDPDLVLSVLKELKEKGKIRSEDV